ncbi:sigma-54-dependent transcriptional regulator [Cytobacillus sp. NCCP-133]|uniref:sigma-54-dependent transcriptional regulator n=1 Tax=Cytobacillus sp. NCCP-133 TaxID=766848 RepID=UPI00222FD99E|nr:sigma-54 dependent transcriptional regulator [Cytobacillus sp. NCCP-133]GLB60285.1 acetoacetate metabolism regulatory protein AtoC [Cytobacillus sp. NCCP-133]
MKKTILLVEDNEKFRRLTKLTLKKEGFDVMEAETGKAAEELMQSESVDLVLLDFLLPDTTGLKLLEKWSPNYPETVFVACTAYGDIEDAVKAMKMGAYDYLTKPIKADELKAVIKRAFEMKTLKKENKELKQAVQRKYNLHGMIGKSQKMQEVYSLIERVASQDITILLEGESGTGKSRCAHAVHLDSTRRTAPFIKVNCAAIPSNLLESELFGFEKGAFTGAVRSQEGKCAAADKGTLFLDEIGEISLDVQAKLLQFAQDKTFTPLGTAKEEFSDVRIIAATNRNLWEMVQNGEFREDLYYRLNIIGITLPPLRERIEDIPLLIEQFLAEFEEEHNRSYTISKDLLTHLTTYPWPGNIRELQNALSRAAVLSPSGQLRLEDFPQEVVNHFSGKEEENSPASLDLDEDFSLTDHLEQVEKEVIETALENENGNQSRAAEVLGITRQGLLYKIRKYKIGRGRK